MRKLYSLVIFSAISALCTGGIYFTINGEKAPDLIDVPYNGNYTIGVGVDEWSTVEAYSLSIQPNDPDGFSYWDRDSSQIQFAKQWSYGPIVVYSDNDAFSWDAMDTGVVTGQTGGLLLDEMGLTINFVGIQSLKLFSYASLIDGQWYNDAVLDELVIRESPEPATFILLCSGFLFLRKRVRSVES